MSPLPEPRRSELIKGLAEFIERHGLKTLAIWLLEMHKPLSFLGSQALLVSQPLLGSFIGDSVIREYASLLEDRDTINQLLEQLTQKVSVLSERDVPG